MTPGTHGISRKDFSRIFRVWEECGKKMQAQAQVSKEPVGIDLDY